MLGAVSFVLLVFSVLIAFFGVSDYDAHRLARQARVATATVKRTVLHPAGIEGYASTVYEFDYVFTAADGTRIESEDQLDDAALARGWDHLKMGDTIPVTYAAGNPHDHRMGTDTSTRTADLIVVGFAGVWLVLASLAVTLGRRWWRAHQAARSPDGAMAPASGDYPRSAAAPISVSASTGFGIVLLLCGAILLLIGVVSLVATWSADRAFRTEGKAATAIVLVMNATANRGGEISYRLLVRFATNEGKSAMARIRVDRATFSSLHEHFPINIIYLREQPTQIRLPTYQPGAPPILWIITALAAVLVAVGAILLSSGFSSAKRQRRARRHATQLR
jgi:hypothetical protein